MNYIYKVEVFLPKVQGCGAQDMGWDAARCQQFQEFLNRHAVDGWRLHSSEFRDVTVKGCIASRGAWLVCVFEKER